MRRRFSGSASHFSAHSPFSCFTAFFSIDEFSGFIKYEFTLSTFAELFRLSNFDVIVRSLVMATAVTLASIIIAFPFAYFAARYARGKWKALFYILVMLPLWSSYLVKVYAWKLILAKEGIISWLAANCISPGRWMHCWQHLSSAAPRCPSASSEPSLSSFMSGCPS